MIATRVGRGGRASTAAKRRACQHTVSVAKARACGRARHAKVPPLPPSWPRHNRRRAGRKAHRRMRAGGRTDARSLRFAFAVPASLAPGVLSVAKFARTAGPASQLSARLGARRPHDAGRLRPLGPGACLTCRRALPLRYVRACGASERVAASPTPRSVRATAAAQRRAGRPRAGCSRPRRSACVLKSSTVELSGRLSGSALLRFGHPLARGLHPQGRILAWVSLLWLKKVKHVDFGPLTSCVFSASLQRPFQFHTTINCYPFLDTNVVTHETR